MPQVVLNAVSYEPVAVRSGLLPVLREQVAERPGCKILDLGHPDSGILEYMRGTQSWVYYNTASDALPKRLQTGAVGYEDPSQVLVEQLDCDFGDMRFDVILAWDYFEYMSMEVLRILAGKIGAWCQPGALLYLQTYQGAAMPAKPVRFQILSADDRSAVRIENQIHVHEQRPRRTPANTLLNWLSGFSIHKLHLMQDVRQEHLFIYRGDNIPD